jgi:ABC-type oligopeptide transport system ATPase subunit
VPGDRRQGSEAILEVADLRVTYDAGATPIQALRGVTLRVSKGDAVGVVGESGSGKTTQRFDRRLARGSAG